MKSLSVIVPAYNMQDYLSQCLESLLSASSDALEILVVNDGSTDQTSEVAHVFSERNPAIVRVIDKPNGHYGSAVNAGLAVASGFYVKVIDADDYVDSLAFRRFVEGTSEQSKAEDNAVDLIVNDWMTVDSTGVELRTYRHHAMQPNAVVEANSLLDVAIRDLQIYALTYRLDALKGISYRQTEGIPYTDTEWSLLPMRMVKTILYVPETVVRYRIGRQGQTMESRTYARDFPVVESILAKVVQGYRDGAESRFFSQCLAVQLGGVYYMHLADPVVAHNPRPNGDLPTFDDMLQKHPELYRLTDVLPLSRKIGFRYIREWRRGRTDRTFKFFLWRLYVHCVAMIMRMAG